MTNKRLRVLMFPKWYPFEEMPLDGNFVENQCEAIAVYCAVKVVFVHSIKTPLQEKYSITSGINSQVEVIRVYFPKTTLPGFLGKAQTLFRYLKAQYIGTKTATQNFTPDLIHSHVLTRSSLLPLLLFPKIPLIISEHFSGFLPQVNLYAGWLKKLATRWVVSKASFIVTPSLFLAQSMQKKGLKGNYRIISNAVDTAFFVPSNTQSDTANPVFLHVSMLSDSPKNVPTILQAFKQFLLTQPNAKLHLVGDGPQFQQQKQLAKTQGLENHVTFFGDIAKAEVAAQMQQAHALLLPSDYEVQGCVAIEALACGTPIIASTVGGTQEYLSADSSILVAPKNVDDLVAAMRKIWLQHAEYKQNALKSNIVTKVSYARVGEEFLQLYTEALAANN